MFLSAVLGRNYSSLSSGESRICLNMCLISCQSASDLPECLVLLSFISDKSKMHIVIFKTKYFLLHITIRDLRIKEKEPFIGLGSAHILT